MVTTKPTLASLARALERYEDRYDALEVYADDVLELEQIRRGDVPPSVRLLGTDGVSFSENGREYVLSINGDKRGIARLTRGAALTETGDAVVLGALIGSAIGAASTAKGSGWLPGLFVGLLAGGVMEDRRKARTIAIRFDPAKKEWRAFGGPLSQWVRGRYAKAS